MISATDYAVWGRFLLLGFSLVLYITTPLRRYMTETAFQELMRDIGNPPGLLQLFDEVTPFSAGDYNQFVNYRHFFVQFQARCESKEHADGLCEV